MFKLVPVEITNSYDFPVENRPFSIGVPCAQGALFAQEKLRLDCHGQSKPFNVTPLASWPDGSMKWFLLDFQASVKANAQLQLQLIRANSTSNQSPALKQVTVSETDDAYLVNTGIAKFTVSKQQAGLFDQVVYDGVAILSDAPSHIQLLNEQGHQAESVISAVHTPDADNTLRRKVSIDGFFQNNDGATLADFNLKLTFYAGLATVKCEFTLSNPQAAEHPGGVWDLGDKGSFFFKALSLKIQMTNTADVCAPSIRLSPDADWRLVENENLMLEQNSSGGENWQSKNHMNFKGEIPMKFKGFRYFEQDVQLSSGDRATPSVFLTSGAGGIAAHVVDFWQNFPKAIQVEQSTLSLSLFPQMASDCYELQGGERKKHTFYLDFSNNKASLDSYIDDMSPRIPLDYYAETKVIPWLPGFHKDSAIQKLIDRGIQGEKNFFDKREAIDEFGWRNFGEIFADHEGLEYKGEDDLISHYNNQYDPLYGFIKQYLISGDKRWHELLSELAQHIVDIDIYHTVKDREEYNGGLFWHTHHYLNAFTCTHRTFSSLHKGDFLYGNIGGGPGDEHCYTTGLSYYYFMTGDTVYKDAALQLVFWLTRVLEGSDTVIERVFQFKSKELPILKRLFAGEVVQRYRYPFTRGTGNYITALIDAYNLTGQEKYLLKVERVIQQSVHPRDDIALRNLKDTESTWSYLIYLQAVCKYLDLKTRLKQFDDACFYARDSLLHYVDWMLENETPFLENPGNLEYPNHTWTAQDLRKANIFYIASLYNDKKKTRYLEAAQYYVKFVEDTLKNEETRHYSRILVLLMQNDSHATSVDAAAILLRDAPEVESYSAAPLYSLSGILQQFSMDMIARFFRVSIKNERRWLSFRMK